MCLIFVLERWIRSSLSVTISWRCSLFLFLFLIGVYILSKLCVWFWILGFGSRIVLSREFRIRSGGKSRSWRRLRALKAALSLWMGCLWKRISRGDLRILRNYISFNVVILWFENVLLSGMLGLFGMKRSTPLCLLLERLLIIFMFK